MSYKVGDAGRDVVGSERAVTGGNDDGIRVRVGGRSPNGSENGSDLDLPVFQNCFTIGILVPVRSVSVHSVVVVLLVCCSSH